MKTKEGQVKIGDYTFGFVTGGKDFRESKEFDKFWNIYSDQWLKKQRRLKQGFLVVPDRMRAESEFNLILAVNGQSAEELTYQ